MKQSQNIRRLLDRYWEGETTLEEEHQIKVFFADGDIPEDLHREAALFMAMRREQAIQMPHNTRVVRPNNHFWRYGMAAASVLVLLAVGVWLWEKYPSSGTPLVAENQTPKKHATPDTPSLQVLSIPEITLDSPKTPLIARKKTVSPYRHRSDSEPEADTYEDPEQALAEIRAVLALVSTKINKSKEALDKGLQEVDHVDILMKRKNG